MELTLDKLKILRDYGLSLGTCTEYSYNEDVLFQLFRINELDYGLYITDMIEEISGSTTTDIECFNITPFKCNKLYLIGGKNLKEIKNLSLLIYRMGMHPEIVDLSFMQSESIISLSQMFRESSYKILGLHNFLYQNRNSIEDMHGMFMYSKIDKIEIDIPFSELRTCSGMFYGCLAESIDARFLEYCGADYSYFDSLFDSAEIENLHIPYISIGSVYIMFNYGSRIHNIYSNSEVIDRLKYSSESRNNASIKNFITVHEY